MTNLEQYARAGKSFKFETKGDEVAGRITQIKDPYERVNDFNGDDETVMSITVETADGEEWSVWPRLAPYSSMGGAIATAAGEHGGSVEIGGTLLVRFHDTLDTGKPHKAKIFVAEYTPPARKVGVETAPKPAPEDDPF